jgi:hypothetical protein
MSSAIAFYISGHGYGHASRQIEVINTLAARRPDVRVLLRTAADRWLLDRTIAPPFDLDSRPCDTGVLQTDSLHLDPAGTIARAREFYSTMDARAEAEAAVLRERGACLVVSDAPPLACEAAERAGIPSIVVSNFTWDWIYADYVEHLAAAPDLLPTIRAAYRRADAAWRLPMHGGFESFRTIVDVPFIARRATRDRSDTRRLLGLPVDRRLALCSFGGYGVAGLRMGSLDTAGRWDIVMTRRGSPAEHTSGIHYINEDTIYGSGLRYEDLVGASDVVLTKPGYGIISECIANNTAVVYTDRGQFAEYPVLQREMPKYLRCTYLDQPSLFAGRWRAALDAAINAPPPSGHPATDGADLIADMIVARVHDSTSED